MDRVSHTFYTESEFPEGGIQEFLGYSDGQPGLEGTVRFCA